MRKRVKHMASLEQCAQAAAAALVPNLEIGASVAKYADHFCESLGSEFKRLDDLALARQFQEYCPVQGAAVADYYNRIIVCPSGLEVVVGIRFKDLNLEKPFVALLAQTKPFVTLDDSNFLKMEVASTYSMFRPQWLRAYISSAHPLWMGLFSPEYAGKALVAATIETVAASAEKYEDQNSILQSNENIKLKRARNTLFYGQYVQAYEHAHKVFPAAREWARLETEEDLSELVAESTLYEIYVNEKWAGIFAGSNTVSHGLQGFCVSEIILAPELRLKRLARTVQKIAAQTLILDGVPANHWFYGTIGWANVPALKTALSADRKVFGMEYWLPV